MALLRGLASAMAGLDRTKKRSAIFVFDGLAMILGLWLAFSARLGVLYWPENPRLIYVALASVLLGLMAMVALGLYRLVIRYFDASAAAPVATASAGAAAVWLTMAYFSKIEGLPRSVGLVYFGVLFMLLFFGRLVASRLLTLAYGPVRAAGQGPADAEFSGVAIYGANPAGASLANPCAGIPSFDCGFSSATIRP